MPRGGILPESFFFLIFLSTALAAPVFASNGLVINEVMINEPGSETSLEWIELFNAGVDSLDLKNHIFIEAADTTRFTSRWVKSHAFVVLSRKPITTDASASFERQWGNSSNAWGDDSLENYPLLPAKMSLRNSGDSVTIVELTTGSSESLKWASSPPDGVSLERINPSAESRSRNFKYCKSAALSTPGKTNSVAAKMHDLGFIEEECEIFVPPEPDQPLQLRIAVENLGQVAVESSVIKCIDDTNFDGLISPYEPTHYVQLDTVLPDSLHIRQLSLPPRAGRQSLLLVLSADDDSSNNHISFEFVVGRFAPELQVTEFVCIASIDKGCEWIEVQSLVDYDISLHDWNLEINGKASLIDSNYLVHSGEKFIVCEDSLCLLARFPELTCHLVQPNIWHPLGNNTGSIVLRTPLNAISDSIAYRGDNELGQSWERDLDSIGTNFESSFYRSTSPAGSTPCAENSIRPVPVAFDIGIVANSLTLDKDSLQASLILAYLKLLNYGYRDVPMVRITVASDVDRDSLLDGEEVLFENESGPIAAGDSAMIQIRIEAPTGRHLFLFQLQDDESAGNNRICGMITTGPQTGELLVTEFLADPTADLESEWIEIRSASSQPIELSGWSFGDLAHQYTLESPTVLAPGEYRVIAQDADAFNLIYPQSCAPLTCRNWANLNNDGDIIIVRDEFGTLSDSVSFTTGAGGNQSLELNEQSTIGLPAWYPSVAQSGATPCAPNSARPSPAANDIGFVPGSLVLQRDSLDFSLIHARFSLLNNAYQASSRTTVTVSEDLNRDGEAQVSEFVSQVDCEPMPGGDTALVGTAIHLNTGRHYLFFQLSPDEVLDNNSAFGCITTGALTSELVITEFLADPAGTLESEWIEIKNVSDYAIDLRGWSCGDMSRQQRLDQHFLLVPGDYAVVAQDSVAFEQFYGNACRTVSPASWSSLNNGGDILILRDEFGAISDSATFSESAGQNRSLERNETDDNSGNIWYPSTATSGSTPCSANSVSGLYNGQVSLTLLNHVFAPHAGEELHFSLQCPPASKFTIEIFDLSGRRRRSLAESQYFSSGEFSYDGTSDSASKLPLGAYILKIESETGDFSQKVGFAVAPPK